MKNYNTSINPLGSIPDINIILETIKLYDEKCNLEEVKTNFIEGNVFGFDLSSSRKRFFSTIRKLYLINEGKEHELFLNTVSHARASNSFKQAALYLETCRNNKLFYDIVGEFIYPKYQENRRLVTSNELFDFLVEFGQGTKLEEWSESTIKTISSKFVCFMKRLGYFEKASGYKSEFSFPYPTEKVITYLVYLLKLNDKKDSEVYNSKLFNSLMLNKKDKISLLKEGAVTGFYEFSLSGAENAEFELNYSGSDIIDELFKEKYD